MKVGALICALCCALLTVALVAMVLYVDVAPIGPEWTQIGLSRINQWFHNLTGVNMFWYTITQLLGLAAIAVAGLFALTGLIQLIQRRSLFEVDDEILALGKLYVAVAALYVMFEFVIINYRPIVMPDALHPEASFPSSHTMLMCTVVGSAMMVLKKYVPNKGLRIPLLILGGAMIAVMVVGRLISGVHWLTDIVGGLLISGMLLSLFRGFQEQEDDDA